MSDSPPIIDADAVRPATAQEAVSASRLRRWMKSWPVLIPVVLIGGLLWATHWFRERQSFIDAFPDQKFQPYWFMSNFELSDSTLKILGAPTYLEITDGNFDRVEPFLDHFRRITRLHAYSLNDTEMLRLPDFSQIEVCHLTACSISDVACDIVAGWPSLRSLNIEDSSIYTLDNRVTITSAGIEKLKSITGLQEMTLHCPLVTDDVFAIVSQFPMLQLLSLTSSQIDGSGLFHLSNAPALMYLRLHDCQFRGNPLAGLRRCEQLVALDLGGSTVSDEMLLPLAEIPALQFLDLTATNVSRAGCRKLLKLRPDLEIEDDTGTLVVLTKGEDSEMDSNIGVVP